MKTRYISKYEKVNKQDVFFSQKKFQFQKVWHRI